MLALEALSYAVEAGDYSDITFGSATAGSVATMVVIGESKAMKSALLCDWHPAR